MHNIVDTIATANAQTSTPWLGLTKIDAHLAGISIRALTRLTFAPNFRYGQHAAYLRFVNEAVSTIFDNAYAGLPKDSRNLLEWAASPTSLEPARLPLRHFQVRSTWDAYTLVWRRMLLYIARVVVQDPDEDRETMHKCVTLLDQCTGSETSRELQSALERWLSLVQSIGCDNYGQTVATAITDELEPATSALITAMVCQTYVYSQDKSCI